MILEGYIIGTSFSNNENNWGIRTFKTENNDIYKIVGNIPKFSNEKKLQIEVVPEQHKKYGLQYQIKSVKIVPITTKESTIKYLSSSVFKGIGPKLAEEIYKNFGAETLNVIKNSPEKLSIVKGISQNKALEFSKALKLDECYIEEKQYLMGHGLTETQTNKIIEKYKEKAIDKITLNPYILIDDFDGVGFKIADKIALKLGIEKDSLIRLERLIIYILEEYCQSSGSTTITNEKLFEKFSKYCDDESIKESKSLYEKAFVSLINSKKLSKFDVDGVIYISISYIYKMEVFIADKLYSINSSDQKEVKNIDQLISQFEQDNNIIATENQKQAIINSLNSNVSIITGGPGTGKTTITKCIIEILKKNNFSIMQAAPTGRAAKRLEESTSTEAKTIHRLLNVQYNGQFFYCNNNKLQCDVLIIDEFSMCDTKITYNLLQAIKDQTKLIIIGDKDQLPSIGSGNVLEDIINSNNFSVSYLTQIFRQKKGSDIKEIAHKINNRTKMNLNNFRSLDGEVVFIEVDQVQSMHEKLIKLITKEIPSKYDCNLLDIQILSPIKSNASGADEINKITQDALNPKKLSKPEIKIGEKIFRVGDKVIHTKNDYSIEWSQLIDKEVLRGVGVFNGEIGIIKNIIESNIYVEYDDFKTVVYSTSEQKKALNLAYAISIHKSQGSEFDIIIIPIVQDNFITNNSKVLYTGITRAKKCLYLLTNQNLVNRALSLNRLQKRETQLIRLLKY